MFIPPFPGFFHVIPLLSKYVHIHIFQNPEYLEQLSDKKIKFH